MYFYRNNRTRNRLIWRLVLIRLGLLELALAPASSRAFSQHQHTQGPLPGRHLSGFRSGRTTVQAPRPAALHARPLSLGLGLAGKLAPRKPASLREHRRARARGLVLCTRRQVTKCVLPKTFSTCAAPHFSVIR